MKRWNKDRLMTVLHRGLIGCLALALALGFGVESLAAKEGKVTASAANIRSSASAGAERVAQLPSESTFTVTEETTDGDGHVWYNIVFTLEGAQKSGWIRSDLAEITAEDTSTEGEGGETAAPAPSVVDGITIQEPAGQPEVTEDFTATQITVGDTAFTAWAVNSELTGGVEFYLVYGMDAAGVTGWYFYDVQQGTLQRAAGQFMGGNSDESEGLIEALRMENEELQKGQTKTLKVRNYIIIALGILCTLLLIIVIVLAVKLSQVEYVDDDYDDDDDEEEESDDRKAGIPSWMEVARARKEEERRQREKKDDLDDAFDDDDDDEEEYMPRQVKRVVQPAQQDNKRAAARAVEKQARTTAPSRGRVEDDDFDDDDDDDFDVEILDLDDLNL